MSRRRRRGAPGAAATLLVGALLAAGCGDDDDATKSDSTAAQPPTRTVTVPTPARQQPQQDSTSTAPEKQEEGRKPASSEDRPGGAGDEEPARSEVVLTGRGGRIGPLLVKVPPFISIRVVLRSGDGKSYVIRFGNRILRAGLEGARSSATFDGLRPGGRLRGVAVSGRVVIEASAEPGP